MSQQNPPENDPLEPLIARHWPAQIDAASLQARLRPIPQQFPQQLAPPPALPVWPARPQAKPLWPWLFGGGLAMSCALSGFAVGALGLLAPAAALDWAALAYGAL
jgi:hypothetical protein